MENKEVAAQFNLLAALMELHGENPFKTKAYLSAYQSLRKWDKPLSGMSKDEIESIPGIGASAATKIHDLLTKGTMEPLESLKSKTPPGIQELLQIKGMGPKKIRVIWDALGVETPAELLYACNENRLVKLPGFGLKTQEDLSARLTYFLDSQNRYLYGVIENDLIQFEKKWNTIFPQYHFAWVGEMARLCPVISLIECLVTPKFDPSLLQNFDQVELIQESAEDVFVFKYNERYTIRCKSLNQEKELFEWSKLTMSKSLFEKLSPALEGFSGNDLSVFLNKNGFKDLPIELMDAEGIENANNDTWSNLITREDLKGILHNHSTWSDGIHTLEEMAIHVRDLGFEYFGICDHSQSAFYANGLQPQSVLLQMEEIDRLNAKMAPFRIFKGIESDILNDGSLDYEPDILEKFELVVASIHSNLRMDIEKATSRLIKAVENPKTRILGHPTSQLLLARPGYPIDHRKVIDACAANDVVMELNANPQRMDIDYSWLPYCQEKGVMVSINPDAHSRTQIGYVKYGVMSARKGALKKENCLNAMGLQAFQQWINKKG
jgi:DNA polymerase (family 10)